MNINTIDGKASTLPSMRRKANADLAAALGWVVATYDEAYSGPIKGIPPKLQDSKNPDHGNIHCWYIVPDYCSDWNAIALLIFKHGLKVEYMEELRKVYVHVGNGDCICGYFDVHGGRAQAICYAATVALTLKLREPK